MTLIEAFLKHLKGKPTLEIGEIAVSWDHRPTCAKRADTDLPAYLPLMGDVYQLPNSSPRNIHRRSIFCPTAGGGDSFAKFYEVPVGPSRPRIVTAKTDDGLRGILRLEACQMGAERVLELVLAVGRIIKGKTLPHKFEDPFHVKFKFGKVEWVEVVAEEG